jgi:hypothetical protein
MDQRDQELLDKQLWGASSSPPRNGSITGLAFIVAFLVGIAIGGILFAHESTQMMQIASHDATNAISFLNVPKADIAPVVRNDKGRPH